MNKNLRENIQFLINKIEELKSNGITDSFELELYFINNMTDLYDEYPFLIKKLCKEKQDLSFLYKMIDSLDKINNGEETKENIEAKLGNELAEQYLYPLIKK